LEKFPKYYTKILLGDFSAKVDKEHIFKPTIGNEILYEINNDNGIRVVNFATTKKSVVKSTMFPHRNIRKCNWTACDGKARNQIDHILVDRRRHSSVSDVLTFRAADSGTDHYLMVVEDGGLQMMTHNAHISYGAFQSHEIK
jgi:hypothetical protein